ncbi:MAG: pilus assembly protein PilP [Gammaproteobacteria bacterium]|nr:pilus assembly protein PilP [Gammaproteobacteria bacterium]
MLRGVLHLFLFVLSSLTLVACSNGGFTDLDDFMNEKRARPGGVIAPIPPFKAYKVFSYSATTLRSPFDRPIEIREITQLQSVTTVKPDAGRAKEFLEQFTFDSLSMVGSLSRSNTDWTLIQDPEGGVHRVKLGNFLGRNHGKIVEVTEVYIAVIEIVSDGNEGWVERPRSIRLSGL